MARKTDEKKKWIIFQCNNKNITQYLFIYEEKIYRLDSLVLLIINKNIFKLLNKLNIHTFVEFI